MMSPATLLRDLRWLREAIHRVSHLLPEHRQNAEAMLEEIAKLEVQIRGRSISLVRANDAVEQLMLSVAVLGWEHEAPDEPDVTPEEFWAALEADALLADVSPVTCHEDAARWTSKLLPRLHGAEG